MAAIKDVAKLAGVSPSAVSKYFRSPNHMRKKTKERIAAAVKELNYHPNSLARSLRNGRSGVVAITVPDVRNPYFGHYVQLMQDVCTKHGLIPLLIQVRTHQEQENAIQILRSGLPDGVICSDDGCFVNQVLNAGLSIPIVQISPDPKAEFPATVLIELKPGILLLCKHLEEQGVRHFSYIGSMGDFSSQEKLQGIQAYCSTHTTTLEDSAVFCGNDQNPSSYEAGYAQCECLLQAMPALPDVIICDSDYTALGALKCLTHKGLRVPDDILLSGYDDTESAFMSNPSITSVRIPLESICNAAINDLLQLLNGQTVTAKFYDTTLSVRTSTLVKPKA